MQRLLLILILYLFPTISISDYVEQETSDPIVPGYDLLYRQMQMEGKVSQEAFMQAVTGFYSLEDRQKEILTLIDFSKPSTEERLYVIDMQEKELLYASHVSHGRNSGDNWATSFSNEPGSYKSSLGFYRTDGTYQGKNGYSLLLNGLEKGINDKARERAVVMHGAPYSDPSVIRYAGRLGRSQGCPALPLKISQTIIDTIKQGSILFIYSEDPAYIENSPVLATAFQDQQPSSPHTS